MDQFFRQLPKSIIAFLSITGGVLFIVISDPPRTTCDAQVELLKEEEKGFLFKDPEDKSQKVTDFTQSYRRCLKTNSPGGCYELFIGIRHALRSFESVPRECYATVGNLTEVRQSVWKSLQLLVEIAWGEEPPETYYGKFGWLDESDRYLYCELKDWAQSLYNEQEWVGFREKQFQKLPGAPELPRQQVWEKMLLSLNCENY